jgi:IS30 family transposase
MRRVDADFHLRVMIESMSRAGCSEREIAAAVKRAGGADREARRERGRSAPARRERA